MAKKLNLYLYRAVNFMYLHAYIAAARESVLQRTCVRVGMCVRMCVSGECVYIRF